MWKKLFAGAAAAVIAAGVLVVQEAPARSSVTMYVIQGSDVAATSGNVVNAFAECFGGDIALGGGFRFFGPSGSADTPTAVVSVYGNRPGGTGSTNDSWTVQIRPQQSGTLRPYVVCHDV